MKWPKLLLPLQYQFLKKELPNTQLPSYFLSSSSKCKKVRSLCCSACLNVNFNWEHEDGFHAKVQWSQGKQRTKQGATTVKKEGSQDKRKGRQGIKGLENALIVRYLLVFSFTRVTFPGP